MGLNFTSINGVDVDRAKHSDVAYLRNVVDQHIKNLLVAHAMFMEIDRKAIDLSSWYNAATEAMVMEGKSPIHECGAAACFGGWCTLHPYFQKLGVSTLGEEEGTNDNTPVYNNLVGFSAAEELFGVRTMFDTNYRESGSDFDLVMSRISDALDVAAARLALLDARELFLNVADRWLKRETENMTSY